MVQLNENTVFDNHYTLIRLLGVGGFSEVWLAHDSYMELNVVLKVYAPGKGMDANSIDEFRHEIRGVFNLNHTNLLKPTYLGIYERMPYLVLPYCSQGSITCKIGHMDEAELWKFIHDVASGLAFLHARDIVHQDIKTDNILLDDSGHYVITDFGISSKARSALSRSTIGYEAKGGTIPYMSPERFSKDPTPIKANDIWSFGAMTFELITSAAPFGELGGGMQKSGAEIPEITVPVSEVLKSTITQMLALNPWERPTAEQLVQTADKHLHGQPTTPLSSRNTEPNVVTPTFYLETEVEGGDRRKRRSYLRLILLLCLSLLASASTLCCIYYAFPKFWQKSMGNGWDAYIKYANPELGVAFINRHTIDQHISREPGKGDTCMGESVYYIQEQYRETDYLSHYYIFYQYVDIVSYCKNHQNNLKNSDYLQYHKKRLEEKYNTEISYCDYKLYTSPNDFEIVPAICLSRNLHLSDLDPNYKFVGYYKKQDGFYEEILDTYLKRIIFCYGDYAYDIVIDLPNDDALVKWKNSDLIISPEITKMYNSAKLKSNIWGGISILLYVVITLLLFYTFRRQKQELVSKGIRNSSAFRLYKWTLGSLLFEFLAPLITIGIEYVYFEMIYGFRHDESWFDDYIPAPIIVAIILIFTAVYKYFMLRYLHSKISKPYAVDYLIPDWYKKNVVSVFAHKDIFSKLSLAFIFIPLYYAATLPLGVFIWVYILPVSLLFCIVYLVRWILKPY